MRGVEGTHSTYNDVFEIGRAAEDKVGAPALICRLLVPLLAGASREEKPALQGVAPSSRLMDKIPCGDEEEATVELRERKGSNFCRDQTIKSSPGGSIPAADFMEW